MGVKRSEKLAGKFNFLKDDKFKSLTKKKSFRISGILVIILILGTIFVSHYVKTNAAANAAKSALRTSVARKGEISTSITGSGPVTSANQVNITPQVSSKVTAIYFKEGDTVKAGDLLFELDDTDAKNNVENAESNILQNKVSSKSSVTDVQSLTVTAPFSGQIKNLNAEIGSTKNKNEALMTLTDTSKLKTTLSFSDPEIKSVKIGTTAAVFSQDFMDSLTGRVTYVSNSPYSTASGGELYSVEIEITNPGSLQDGMSVTAEIKTSKGIFDSIESGTLKYVNQTTIKSSAGGTVTKVNARDNQYVKKGDLLVKLENEDAINNKLVSDIKTGNLEEQLLNAQNQLEYCKVYAPIDGMITKENIKVGDSVKLGDTAFTIANYNTMQIQISVDELDIESVKVGQDVNVTVDAIKETSAKPIAGKVSKIAVEGTSNNGVTTYPVTILIDENEKLKGGMNATAEIYISKKTDILYVPIEAVIKRGNKNYVMIKSDEKTIAQMKKDGTYIDLFSGMNASNRNSNNGTTNSQQGGPNGSNNSSSGSNSSTRSNAGSSANGNTKNNSGNSAGSNTTSSRRTASSSSTMTKYKDYYAASYPVLVELGVNNETSIEILSGIKDGDIVVLPPITTTSSSTTSSRTGGQMGITGGSMPGGTSGFPEGGPRN